MAGYAYLLVKLKRSLKSDIKKDKPNYSVVDVVPVGVPSPHHENSAPYASKTTTIEHCPGKVSESFHIKVEYVDDNSTSLSLEEWGDDVDFAQEKLDVAVNKAVEELKGCGKSVKPQWLYDAHRVLQGVVLNWKEGCIWIDVVPVAIKPSTKCGEFTQQDLDFYQERLMGQYGGQSGM